MKNSSTPSLRARHSEWIRLLAFAVLIFVARSSLANHYYVPSGSMQPILKAGDRVVVDMTAYGVALPFSQWDIIEGSSPMRGDIVVFGSPHDGERLIKRVVALPGDRVSVHEGHVSINGISLGRDEVEYMDGRRVALDLSYGPGPSLSEWVVPADTVLVMGDARGNSFDGRMFGPVPIKGLYGRATYRYYRSGEGFQWASLSD